MANHFVCPDCIHIPSCCLKPSPPARVYGQQRWLLGKNMQVLILMKGTALVCMGYSHTQQNILPHTLPVFKFHQHESQNTLSNCPESPQSSSSPALPLTDVFLLSPAPYEELYKLLSIKYKPVPARLASLPLTCFSHVNFLCSFEGKEKNNKPIPLYKAVQGNIWARTAEISTCWTML